MLEHEGQKDTEFQVKNLRLIHAQVKIVKCTVQNIAVDISFNQMAGVSALCFLEQVDQVIGKGHLFKQSLIFIKAWCYYESRILGAKHGLISTYALETLVLYIINFFYSSLNSPLAVLYKFLAYFSTFEWDRYGVSLNGPVPLSSLPEVLAELPKKVGEEQLFHREFLWTCRHMFAGPTRVPDGREHGFPIKHINIVDPLKDDNNLGRSISKSNFYRIKCALTYGARKLEEILTLAGESMGEELKKFYATTLDTNGRGRRPDVQVPVSGFGAEMVEISDLSGDSDTSLSFLQYFQWYISNTLPLHRHPSPLLLPAQVLHSPRDALGPDSFLQRNTCFSVPGEPYNYPNKQLPITGYGIEEMASLATSTNFCDSLDMIHHSFRDLHLLVGGQKSESSSGLLQKPTEDCDRPEVPLDMDKKGKSLHHPWIQGTLPSLIHAAQPNLKPAQASFSYPSDNLGFGSSINPPSPSIHQYKLEDEDDFPPLSNCVDAYKKLSKA